MKCFSAFHLKTSATIILPDTGSSKDSLFSCLQNGLMDISFGDTAKNSLRKLGGGTHGRTGTGRWHIKPSGKSEVVSPTYPSCPWAFGCLCPEVADLVWERSPCFFHPTTVALILGSLQMSSRKDLPTIFFSWLHILIMTAELWRALVKHKFWEETKYWLARLLFPKSLLNCCSVSLLTEPDNLIPSYMFSWSASYCRLCRKLCFVAKFTCSILADTLPFIQNIYKWRTFTMPPFW